MIVKVAIVLLKIESRIVHYVWPDTRLTACGTVFSSYVVLSKAWLGGSILCKRCVAEVQRRGEHKNIGILGELGAIREAA
jgi:hypothetical protein